MSKPFVYIASPYTKGDQAINTHNQCKYFDMMMDDGIVYPYVPLWSHFQHIIFPRKDTDWIEYDLELLKRFDACLRVPAELRSLDYYVNESPGGDAEVRCFQEIGKPVFYDLEDCYDWAKGLAVRP